MRPRDEGILIDEAINAFHAPAVWRMPTLPRHLEIKFDAYREDQRSEAVDPRSVQARKTFNYGRGVYTVQIDQARGGKVWDVKFSRRSAEDLIFHSLPQLIIGAYAFNLRLGGIINVRNYDTSRPVILKLETTTKIGKLMKLVHEIIEVSL